MSEFSELQARIQRGDGCGRDCEAADLPVPREGEDARARQGQDRARQGTARATSTSRSCGEQQDDRTGHRVRALAPRRGADRPRPADRRVQAVCRSEGEPVAVCRARIRFCSSRCGSRRGSRSCDRRDGVGPASALGAHLPGRLFDRHVRRRPVGERSHAGEDLLDGALESRHRRPTTACGRSSTRNAGARGAR